VRAGRSSARASGSAARAKNTEGVGESRGYESSSRVMLRRGAEVLRRLFFTSPRN